MFAENSMENIYHETQKVMEVRDRAKNNISLSKEQLQIVQEETENFKIQLKDLQDKSSTYCQELQINKHFIEDMCNENKQLRELAKYIYKHTEGVNKDLNFCDEESTNFLKVKYEECQQHYQTLEGQYQEELYKLSDLEQEAEEKAKQLMQEKINHVEKVLQENTNLTLKLSALQKEYDELHKLKSLLAKEETEIINRTNEIMEDDAKINVAVPKLNEEITNITLIIEQNREEYKKSYAEINDFSQEMDSQKKDLDTKIFVLLNTLKNNENYEKQLHIEVDKIENEIIQVEEDCNNLEVRSNTLHEESKEAMNDIQNKIVTCDSEIEKVKETTENVKEDNTQKENELKSLENAITSLDNEILKLNGEYSDLVTSLDSDKESRERFRKEIELLLQEIPKIDAETENLKLELSSETAKHEEEKTAKIEKISTLNNEGIKMSENYKEKKAASEKRLTEVEFQNKEMQDRLINTNKQLEDIRSELEQFNKLINEYTEELKQLEIAFENYSKEVTILEMLNNSPKKKVSPKVPYNFFAQPTKVAKRLKKTQKREIEDDLSDTSTEGDRMTYAEYQRKKTLAKERELKRMKIASRK